MSSQIHVLPKNLANQIAAGEVIERPFSVVKELVENALDAGATDIVVHIMKGGKDLIEVIDNGTGMSPEDAQLSLQRFATSKIRNEEDLFNIHSFGFRGEALPSIASVSICTLQTQEREAAEGIEIRVKGGTQEWQKTIGMNAGTRVVVEHLFFNIPARKKYLKSDATELSHVVEYVTNIALIHPAISFTLTHNGKKVFQLARRESLLERISDLFGSETGETLLPLTFGQTPAQLTGFISHPRYTKPTSKYEFFFVNSRPIKNQMMHKAFLEGYDRTIERGAFPFLVLNLQLDPRQVDVNVHPRKLEVRFEDSQRMFQFCKKAVEDALQQGFLQDTPIFTENQQSPQYSSVEKEKIVPLLNEGGVRGGYNSHAAPRSPYAFRFDPKSTNRVELPTTNHPLPTQPQSYFKKILGQIHNCYIIFETARGFGVADQHAAHEIILYHQIKTEHEQRQVVTQKLLTPWSLHMPAAKMHLLENNHDFFTSLGFDLQLLGAEEVLVNAVPATLVKADAGKVITDLLDEMAGYSQRSLEMMREKIYATMACRAAVKFGDPLSLEEQTKLLRDLERLNQGYSCPHGRPVLKEFTLQEMLKWFKR